MRPKSCVSITISRKSAKQSTLRIFMRCFSKFLNCFLWHALLEGSTFVLLEEYHLISLQLKNFRILNESTKFQEEE